MHTPIFTQINSNLADKLYNKGYYIAQDVSGNGVTVNDMVNPGIYRFYVNARTDNANYLGWSGRTIVICTRDCAGYIHQIFFGVDSGYCAVRRNAVQSNLMFDYNTKLSHVDSKTDIAALNSRVSALENMLKS